jgi:uncharacterized RDD family membrane protein YckC
VTAIGRTGRARPAGAGATPYALVGRAELAGSAAVGRAAYAGSVSRSIAYVVDALIVSILAIGAVTAVTLVAAAVGAQARDLAHAVVSVSVVLLPSLLALYMALFWILAGRTPAMALLGLRVVRSDGGPVGWFSALVRAAVLAYFPIGALWLLVDRRHQGIHDKLARTVVVRAPSRATTTTLR